MSRLYASMYFCCSSNTNKQPRVTYLWLLLLVSVSVSPVVFSKFLQVQPGFTQSRPLEFQLRYTKRRSEQSLCLVIQIKSRTLQDIDELEKKLQARWPSCSQTKSIKSTKEKVLQSTDSNYCYKFNYRYVCRLTYKNSDNCPLCFKIQQSSKILFYNMATKLKTCFIIWQQNNQSISNGSSNTKISIFNQKASEKCFDTVGQMPGRHPTHL